MTTLIMGGSGGLGREVMHQFPGAANWSLDTDVDLEQPWTISEAASMIDPEHSVTQLINCAGVNLLYPFDELLAANPDSHEAGEIERCMTVNAFAFPRVVAALRRYKALAPGAVLCNVISNAAKIPMTHSLAYNMSKAAQEMATRQMARELKEYSIFGINPNKLIGTGMSLDIEARVLELRGWTAEEAKRYQLAALPAGLETPPAALALFIKQLMHPAHHPFLTGCIVPYGGPIQ